MTGLRFHFLDDARGEDARLAAAILADCLSRQGFQSNAKGTSVAVEAAPRRERDAEEVFVVLDEHLLASAEVLCRLDSRSAVVVCSARPARTLKHELGRFTAGVATVDASGIAIDEGADPVVAVLGGAARAIPLIDPEVLSASVWNTFDRQLPYAAQAAVRAFDLGYAQTQLALA